jgi:hypothetical protein
MTRIIPDVDFRASTNPDTAVDMTVKAYNYPGQGELYLDDGKVTRSASQPVDLYTGKLDVRLRGRAFSLRVDSTDTGVAWRLGAPRVSIKPDGKR